MNIFLSTPITLSISKTTGLLMPRIASRINQVAEKLRLADHNVFSAIERESWGRNLMPSNVCTPLDFEQMNKANHVVAITGNQPSEGVLVELGWASAMGIDITLLNDTKVQLSPLVCGLSTICNIQTFTINWNRELKEWELALHVRGLI